MPTCAITWAAPPSSKVISPLLRGAGDLWDLGLLLLNFGLEETQAGSPVAGGLLTEALRIWQQLRSRPGMALALAGLGEVAAGSGQAHPAGQLLGAAAWPRDRAGRSTGQSTRVWPARHVLPKPRPGVARR